jgi:hypothetical protein
MAAPPADAERVWLFADGSPGAAREQPSVMHHAGQFVGQDHSLDEIRCEGGAVTARGGDRGAQAVEFALVVPLLLVLVFGIIDFGRALNAQISLNQAAREGVRASALGQPLATVQSRTIAAADPLPLVAADVIVAGCPASPLPADNATVTVKYSFTFITPIGPLLSLFGGGGFTSAIAMQGKGVMRCNG